MVSALRNIDDLERLFGLIGENSTFFENSFLPETTPRLRAACLDASQPIYLNCMTVLLEWGFRHLLRKHRLCGDSRACVPRVLLLASAGTLLIDLTGRDTTAKAIQAQIHIFKVDRDAALVRINKNKGNMADSLLVQSPLNVHPLLEWQDIANELPSAPLGDEELAELHVHVQLREALLANVPLKGVPGQLEAAIGLTGNGPLQDCYRASVRALAIVLRHCLQPGTGLPISFASINHANALYVRRLKSRFRQRHRGERTAAGQCNRSRGGAR
jgi:hypothetical protein